MGWKSFLFLFFVIIALIFTAAPPIMRAQKAGNRTKALSGCKILAGGLISFRSEYGHFPCDLTREALKKEGLKNIPAGNDANAYLSQLIATDIIDSESIFHCKAGKGFHKGDDEKDTPHKILAPGENSYAYVMTQGGNSLRPITSITPIVIAPIVTGGTTPTFNPDLYEEYFVFASVAGSGHQGKIDADGHAILKGRGHIFQTGPDSLFGQQVLDVKLPTPRY